mgnify:CR=1 FL=1
MFEGQPKGLYALALANTGERFGYYTMLAIFTLFLQVEIRLYSRHDVNNLCQFPGRSVFHAAYRRYPGR